MHPVQIILLIANAVAFPLLWWLGNRWERLAVVVMVLGQVASHALVDVTWRGMRSGVFSVDLLCFLLLWALAERAGRWWLVAATGFQLVGVLAHLAPFFAQERLAWALITLLWIVWILISTACFFGVWEAWADRRFAREGRHGSTLDGGRGARPVS